MQSSSPLPRACAGGAGDPVGVLLPQSFGQIRDAEMRQEILPCPSLLGAPCLQSACATVWPRPCTLPVPWCLSAPGSPMSRDLPEGVLSPSIPMVLPAQAVSEPLLPHFPTSLPASGSRCRAAGTGGHCLGPPCSGAGLPSLSPSSSLLGSCPQVLTFPSSALLFPVFSCLSNNLQPLRSNFGLSA